MGLSLPLKSFEIVENKTSINNTHYLLKQLQVMPGYECFLAVKAMEDILKDDISFRRIDLSIFL